MIALVLRLALDPRVAGYAASAAMGAPELGPVLERVCERESGGCRPIGPHAIDAAHGRTAWLRAVSAGYLQPGSCPHHSANAGPWSTSGPWGMMRAYSLHRLGCMPAWYLDLPIVGAVAAVLRASDRRCQSVARCRSWLR